MDKINLNCIMSLKELECIVDNLITPVSLPAYKRHILEIQYETDSDGSTEYVSSMPLLPFSRSDVFKAHIISWRRLTGFIDSDKCKNVYEVTFDVKDSEFRFKAGDTIGLLPQNHNDDVENIITHLGLNSVVDLPFKLSVGSGQKGRIPSHIPEKSSLRHVLKHCLELRGVLKKLFLLALSEYTQKESEKNQLQYLCSSEGTTAYRMFILNPSFSILDVFKTFQSCKPPIEVLLAYLPRLLPRPYSIVNSGVVNNNVVKICFSVLPRNKGVTTGWLEDIILRDETDDFEKKLKYLTFDDRIDNSEDKLVSRRKVDIYLRTNNAQFSLPESEKPLILIAIGTAVSPFIGFLEEIENKGSTPKPVVWLFFGCRAPNFDNIYGKELNGFLERGILTKLNTTFSSQNNSEEKHVQDSLKLNSKEVASLIHSGASVFVCGDLVTFAGSVKLSIQNCLIDNGSSEVEAADTIRNMEKEKRYVIDSWA